MIVIFILSRHKRPGLLLHCMFHSAFWLVFSLFVQLTFHKGKWLMNMSVYSTQTSTLANCFIQSWVPFFFISLTLLVIWFDSISLRETSPLCNRCNVDKTVLKLNKLPKYPHFPEYSKSSEGFWKDLPTHNTQVCAVLQSRNDRNTCLLLFALINGWKVLFGNSDVILTILCTVSSRKKSYLL